VGSDKALLDLLSRYGQEGVLRFWDELSAEERLLLDAQARSLDLKLISRLAAGEGAGGGVRAPFEPEPFVRLPHDEASTEVWCTAAEEGRVALRQGRVAAMVVAGGQGTRLGFAGPKGAYPIGPITDRTLFQIHAQKVLAASQRYGVSIPLLVMTSPTNDAETRFFFKEHGFFGLPFDRVRIFSQGEMPAIDDSGKLILESKARVFMSPNGHGGALKALWDTGVIAWLEGLGVDTITHFQVDNPLVRVIDPAFIGFHLRDSADMSLKLLKRTIPDEKLGIWLRVAGHPRVIEYSDMTPEDMHARDDAGDLKYAGGSIAIHCFSVPFIRRLNESGFLLPYHRARKKVPCVSDRGERVEPREPNATKFEMFIFDALLFSSRAVAVETAREDEFSPVKNASGVDSPDTAKRDMSRLYAKWLASVGVDVPAGSDGYPLHPIEISPLIADGPEVLECNYTGPKSVAGPLLLE
jgi:UDP-N-acetylglucosamine/UDP-N-acetylgalactosamine diphosphorylase